MTQSEATLQLDRACLVVAHPDDEVLWFSSILADVGRVVVCFEECDDLPELGPGRRALCHEYPRAVEWLRQPEPCSAQLVDWSAPAFGRYGLELNAVGASDERYRNCYDSLRAQLAQSLRGVRYVFTHNPWGEYGHPDHVQVCRVIESLRDELGYRVLHSGYVASRTMPLAARELPRLTMAAHLPTNSQLVETLVALYCKHDCWTWPPDFQRFDGECFLEHDSGKPRPGSGFTLNCVTA